MPDWHDDEDDDYDSENDEILPNTTTPGAKSTTQPEPSNVGGGEPARDGESNKADDQPSSSFGGAATQHKAVDRSDSDFFGAGGAGEQSYGRGERIQYKGNYENRDRR